MECPYCKTENRDGVRYCGNCGRPMGTTVPNAPPTTGGSGIQSRTLIPGSKLQGGRYVVQKVLGQGGMGAALLATDIRLDSKPVVIKELISDNVDPTKLQDDVRNFKREVSTLAHIDHPLVPSVTDRFQEGPRYFMVQEYVEGENLEEVLNRLNQPLKERDILIYASQVLDILDYLARQTQPVIHRDIKPANIIIGARDKRAHLVDFGIARADTQGKQTTALGTPGYAPPEQYQGNADPRSDLYALAATIHHLLTNHDPRNYSPFAYPAVRTLNPQLSADIERVLIRALTNDINQRYQSAATMKQDIDTILQQRFGFAGNTDSYILGLSTPMQALGTGFQMPTGPQPMLLTQPQPTIPVQPLPTQPAAGPVATPPFLNGNLGQSSPSWSGIGVSPSNSSASWPSPSTPPVPPVQRQRSRWLAPLTIVLILLLLLTTVLGIVYLARGLSTPQVSKTPVPTTTGTPLPTNGIGAVMLNNEPIGISDGSIVLDTGRANANFKQKAADSYKKGDLSSAMAYWSQAITQDTADAESLIYKENQRVVNSPHVTLVVATMLTGATGTVGVGYDSLQGAYVAQKEFNDGAKLTNGVLVRLLIANAGSSALYAKQVAEQIVLLAHQDPTFVGVMGWPFSSRAVNAVPILSAAHIPMVSQAASSDQLTGLSPYFFRIVAPNKDQAAYTVQYAENVLHAKRVVMFEDISDPYSESLASDFSQKFQADGNTIITTENYTIGKPATISSKVADALSSNPDLIYFSGYSDDVGVLLVNLPPGDMPVLGGDALYELGGYPSSARPNFSRLHFAAYAYPDEWAVLGYTNQEPAFFNEYIADFDPNGQHPLGIYSFTRADNDTILSYDALVALLKGYDNALKAGKTQPTPQDVQEGLKMITGANSFQGASGQISFGADGDPVNKALVILHVDNGHIKMQPFKLGQFLK